MHQLLFMRRQGFPLQIFRLLAEPTRELATQFLHAPACLRDELSHELLSRFPSESALLGSKCKAILSTIAARREYDICAIECRHAASRRVVTSSTQTWARSLEHVSAHWTARQHRMQWESVHGEPPAAQVPENPPQPPKPKKSRARSVWATFLHEQAKGRRTSCWTSQEMNHLKQKYAQLSQEEREWYRQIAAAASAAVSHGQPAFGTTRAQQKAARYRERRAAEQQAQAHARALELQGRHGMELEGASSLAFQLQEQLERLRAEKKENIRSMKQSAAAVEDMVLAQMRDSPAPVLQELRETSAVSANCHALPEPVPTAEFCPPLADMTEAHRVCQVTKWAY